MNNIELQTLIMSHYENEAQTLTSGAEANILKFKEMNDIIPDEEAKRWEDIKEIFRKQQQLKGFGSNKQIGAILEQMENISSGLGDIGKSLNQYVD